MRTVTPLLVLDAARAEEGPSGHKRFPVRMVGGEVYIPPTSIKGMLRSAYEAITNSRFGVFPRRLHAQRLGYRRDASSAVRLVPARIERGPNGSWRVRLLFGWVDPETDVKPDGRPKGNPPLMYAAWLRRYQKYTHPNVPFTDDKGEQERALKYPENEALPCHGNRVLVKVKECRPTGRPFRYLRVTEIRPDDGQARDGEYPGWVCITGRNAMQKYNERVFLDTDKAKVVELSNAEWEALERDWNNLIANYREANKAVLEERRKLPPGRLDREDRYLGHDPGCTGLSRHIWDEEHQKLNEGTLCYAEIKIDGTTIRVLQLYPVNISRALYRKPPWELLHPSLRPAASIDELSPADRVFGWVAQEGQQEGREPAWRGGLRVSRVTCLSPDPVLSFADDGLPLAILGQPKPQQGRFYAAKDPSGTPLANGTPKESAYQEGQGLRGRKVYPHCAVPNPDTYWGDPLGLKGEALPEGWHREYVRPPKDGEAQRDTQNRSVLGWIKPGVEFRFDLYVENLSDVELGALLWLLSLGEGYYHRLGGGKPLGFGSVHLAIEASELRTGRELRREYLSLAPVLRPDANEQSELRSRLVRAFQQAVASAYGHGGTFEAVPFVAAFLQAARGFQDGKPIHYPRTSEQRAPDPDGEGYRWFVSNEKGDRLALPPLWCESGLPYLAEDRRGS